MTRLRAEMLRLFKLAARRRLALAYLLIPAAFAPAIGSACYSTGDGTPPPPSTFYFPVGLTVSKGGNVLYVVNSDFDLQWNGGTIQSYDLHQIRKDAAVSAAGYSLNPQLPLPEGGGLSLFLDGGKPRDGGVNPCLTGSFVYLADGGLISPCAPYINSSVYVRDTVTIGAFATDLQLSKWGTRLYSPVRGDASLTWLTVSPDIDSNGNSVPPTKANEGFACDADGGTPSNCYAPFSLQCGQTQNGGRCDATHHAGVNPFEPGNTRNVTMPGEPFAMAQTDDGTAIVMTHQSEGETSLFLTGFISDGGPANPSTPSMQFIVDAGLPLGGDGIANIPHDPGAFECQVASNCPEFPRPAFMETNNTAAQLNLIRYYADDGVTVFADAAIPDANLPLGTSLQRPYITVEGTYPITALSSGTDSRGIVFDNSARVRCENQPPILSMTDPKYTECAQIPARMFFANRAPASLVIGSVGGASSTDSIYSADALSITKATIPLDAGPSRVYLAPIIDSDGNYALRVFVVCFDGNSIEVVNPDTGTVEADISVGEGPFAMTFDPFDPVEVALRGPVQPSMNPTPPFPFTPEQGAAEVEIQLPRYRFAYVASFTNSYVQVIDLNNSAQNAKTKSSTFETVVYTLGTPSVPKGNQ